MADEVTTERHSGHCMCGAVSYRIDGAMRPVLICHCSQCLRSHGHYAAYTAVPRGGLTIEGVDNVAWYRSSDIARRGFCRVCGSRLFWDRDGADYIAVAAGTLDPPTGLHTLAHIFVADKSDYYQLDENLNMFPQGYGKPAGD